MRILIVSNLFPPGFIGGYELGALEMARGLAGFGHEIEVVTSTYFLDDRHLLGEFPVRRVLRCTDPSRLPSDDAQAVTNGAFLDGQNIRLLSQELLRFRPDRVLCFNIGGLGVMGLLHYLVAIGYQPILYLMDNVFARVTKEARARTGFDRTFGTLYWLEQVRFIFMSRNLAAEVEATLGCRISPAAFIPGWFDQNLIAGGNPDLLTADGSAPTRFLFASRVAPHKGINLILEATQTLLAHGHDRFTVDIYGDGEVPNLLQTITARRLQNHVRHCGCPTKDELLPKFALYEALLFPTWQREPFGFIVAEAAAAGCIPIMTAGIGAGEWFLDGVDSFKIRNDVDGVATAMLQTMLMPVEERRTMGRRAQITADRFLTFAKALLRLQSVLETGDTRRPPGQGGLLRDSARPAAAAMEVLTELWGSGRDG